MAEGRREDNAVKLFLQFGHGMMELCEELIEQNVASTVILSPRDLSPKQLLSFSRRVVDAGGSCLLDPQFYLPSEEHKKLTRHVYWPRNYSTVEFWDNSISRLIGELWELNRDVGATKFVLPGLFANSVTPLWTKTQRASIAAARREVGAFPLVATLALGADLLSNNAEVERVLEEAVTLDVEGIYLVPQKPSDRYYSGNPNWLANVLDIAAGVRLSGREMIVGYANQELLCLAASAVTAIASGSWMNVRSFPLSKFREGEEELRMRATWFYEPNTFSEFKIPTLDIAQRQGVLRTFQPSGQFRNIYGETLFFGGQPSTSGFREREAFRHYLFCIGRQCAEFTKGSLDDTLLSMRSGLDRAETTLGDLKKLGLYDPVRSFHDHVPNTKAALAAHEVARGAILRRKWQSLTS